MIMTPCSLQRVIDGKQEEQVSSMLKVMLVLISDLPIEVVNNELNSLQSE